jgi:predicted amidohydrolase
MRVMLAQVAPTLGDMAKNVKIHRECIDRAIDESVDLIVFPELSLTGYFVRDLVPEVSLSLESEIMGKFVELSKKISIAFGFVEETKDFLFYNSAVYLEDGLIKHVHRKVYLPTYGMFDEARYFARGDRIRAFDTRFGGFAMLICEDAWHPSAVYVAVMDSADYLLFLSSSPARGVGRHAISSGEAWETVNRMNAELYGCYVFYTNRGGQEEGVSFWGGSEIVLPNGQLLIKGPYFEEACLAADVDTREIRRSRLITPISRDENIDLTLRELVRIYEERFEGKY